MFPKKVIKKFFTYLFIIIIGGKRTRVVRRVITEIAGRSPYERKIMELLKQSKSNSNKKAYKMAKKCLGTHKRAQKKRSYLTDVIASANK